MAPSSPYLSRFADLVLDEFAEQLSAVMINGPRASGKTTTARQRAATVVRLDVGREAAAFIADPEAALRDLPEPVLLDEWQAVPSIVGAVRRAVEDDPRPNRFILTGSVMAQVDHSVWGTGRTQSISMYPMTVRERLGLGAGSSFLDRVLAGETPEPRGEVPDLAGYVDLALQSGFPGALSLTGRAHRAWLSSYLDDLLTRDVATLTPARGRSRDSRRLRRYFNAYALNAAGEADHKTIYDAASISRMTALSYDELLTRLYAIEEVSAWTTNRLKRLKESPKRYVVEPALVAAALGLDARGVIGDGDVLGRMIDGFVAAQLRPEIALSEHHAVMHHVRTQSNREEVDIVIEFGGGRVVGIEGKADSAPGSYDARHLKWMRDRVGKKFVAGLMFHTGPRTYEIDDRVSAVPIAAIWS